MTIGFNGIPVGIRTPGQFIEFDSSRALQGLPGIAHKILVIGQRLTTGDVAAGVPTQILTAGQAQDAFGVGSMLAQMLAALKAVNARTECWAVALDDAGAGVKATGTLTVAVTTALAGTIVLYIAGTRIAIAVTAAEAQNDIATAIAAAVNALAELPVTAAAVTNVVTLTANHKGEYGNAIDVRLNYYPGEALPGGVSIAIVAMGSVIAGATNPDVATAITAVAALQFNTIVMPYTDATNLGKIEAELLTRWGPLVQQEGQAFAGAAGSHATLTTLGGSRNSQFLTIMGTNGSPMQPCVWAAVVGAVDAAEPDPARPRQSLALTGLLAPAGPTRFTRAERDLLLHTGIATFTVDEGGTCYIERLITTYQTNPQSIDDPSYLDIETMRTLAYLRATMRARIALKYPRHKLADDGTRAGPGQKIVTPSVIRHELLALFRDWEAVGLVEGFEQFKTELVIERDGTDVDRVNALLPPDLVNQFRVFAGQIQFLL